ncbi:hypothetical protein V6245_06240 [Salinibacterium amurskyense]|uniref:SCO7613 C-terminal domain-containing membrane protein n=1 Tax=Salinibacterium amurskyense TaxID=205941 RepID=UPI00311FF773
MLPPSAVCSQCGLDLNHPDAALLREESHDVATLLDARLELIGKIRFETAAERKRLRDEARDAEYAAFEAATAHRAARSAAAPESDNRTAAAATAATAATPATPAASANTAIPGATTPAAHDSTISTPANPPHSGTEVAGKPHSGIQVLLLVVGVSLLSIGAIFFLIYAFLTFGLIWRSAIIASITIASIVTASAMKRRGLAATGEALSALAVVLVILDIYALRANDLVVLGDEAGRLYWGGALLLAALGFMLWHRASALVLVNVVGFALFPLAAALLAAGLADESTFDTAALAALVALAAASLIHVFAAHGSYTAYAERIICVVYALFAFAGGLVLAAFTHTASSNNDSVGWVFALAALAALHGIAAWGRGNALMPGLHNAFAAVAGVLLGAALWIAIIPRVEAVDDAVEGADAFPFRLLLVVAALTATALASETIGRRLATAGRLATFWAAVGVWIVTGTAAIIPLFQSLFVALQFTGQQDLRRITPGSALFDVENGGWPQLTLLIVPLAMAIVWWLTRQLRGRLHSLLGSAGIALALAAPLTGTLLNAVIAWLILATAALVSIARDRRRNGARRIHVTIAAGGLLPLVLAYSSGWSSHHTWVLASVVTAALLVAARSVLTGIGDRAALLGSASIVLLLAAAGVGEQLQFGFTDGQPNQLESWLAVGAAGVLLLALSFWKSAPQTSTVDRLTVWWIGLSATSLAAAVLWIASINGAPSDSAPLVLNLPVVSFIIAAAALVVLALTMTGRVGIDRLEARYTAAALLAPATVWALDSASRALGLSDIAIQLAPATASVLVGAASMALRVRGLHPRMRRVSEISALTVAGITAANAIVEPRASHWLIVLLVSITLLLASIARDGIFGSHSPRRHLVWAAVAFGTWALWLRLDQGRVEALEAYVLPLAAVVLIVGTFTARAELHQSRLVSAPAIVLAALLIAVLPLGLNAASGSGLHTLIIAGLSGALLLIACFVEPHDRLVDFWGVAIVAAGVGLVATTGSRALVLASQSTNALPELDSWLLGAVAVIALGSFGLASTSFTTDPAHSRWAPTSEILLGTALVLLFAIETLVLLDSGSVASALDSIRIVGLVVIGSSLLLVTARPSARPLTHRISYLAFGLASVVGAIAALGGLITPVEWVTVPLGAAVLIHGVIRMARAPGLRSFSALTAGLAVILLPSLIATFIATDSLNTVWRILALGIASVVAIVAGSWLKLQAPLVIGAVVALIHASHTFAPAIVALYQLTDWWLWAVVGGAIVLFLGITLERRIRDLKTLNTKFSALR